jgi:hypothetical protein
MASLIAGALPVIIGQCSDYPLAGDVAIPSITEADARGLLDQLFQARGLTVEHDVPFSEGGVVFSADGYDRQNRVGYDYFSSGDQNDLSDEEIARLNHWDDRKGPYFLIVDHGDLAAEYPNSIDQQQAALTDQANQFLDYLESIGII